MTAEAMRPPMIEVTAVRRAFLISPAK